MRIMPFDQYGAGKLTRALVGENDRSDEQPEWFGVVIGPRSDEARVLIDGHVLQAGRVLALRSTRYQLEAARKFDTSLACIQYLELGLLEHPNEFALDFSRPNLKYDASALVNAGATSRVLSVPFVGRRQCLFVIHSPDSATVTYTVYGLRYQASARAVKEVPLHTATATALDATKKTIGFYIGGTNEGECWDALALDITTPGGEGGARTWNTDAETIGELGAR